MNSLYSYSSEANKFHYVFQINYNISMLTGKKNQKKTSYIKPQIPILFYCFCTTVYLFSFFNHCIVCPSSYGIWLPLRYLQSFLNDVGVNFISCIFRLTFKEALHLTKLKILCYQIDVMTLCPPCFFYILIFICNIVIQVF